MNIANTPYNILIPPVDDVDNKLSFISIIIDVTKNKITQFNEASEYLLQPLRDKNNNARYITFCKQCCPTLLLASTLETLESKRPINNYFSEAKSSNDNVSWILWDIIPFEHEDNLYIQLIGKDITSYYQSKANETQLKSTLDNIINHVPHYILWKDRQSVFLGCNKMLADSLGLNSPEEVMGKTDFDFPWTKEQSEAYRADDQDIMFSGKPKLGYEEYQKQADGSERIMLCSKVPLKDALQNVCGILAIYTDITEIKEKEHILRIAKNEAEAANNIKSEFIRNMEHDIRTPFSGIHGMANILAQQENDTNKKEMLTDIASCAKELLDYCNDILDFSQIEAGALPVINKKFELHSMLKRIEEMETPPAKLKELDFKVNIDSQAPKLLIGDAHRIKRILINLISNAIKFTSKGHVHLYVNLVRARAERDVILQFIIHDSGIGIPIEKQNMVYEKFTRLVSANKGTYRGQGLGLRIVKQFMEEMDGDVEIESTENKGTKFICTIPFKLPLAEGHIETQQSVTD